MIIPITPKWRIASDSLQWMTQEYAGLKKETQEEVWTGKTFHSTLEQARKSLTDRLVRDIDTHTVEDAIREIKAVGNLVEDAMNNMPGEACD